MKKTMIYGLLISIIIGAILSLFASSFPDGLEKVAEQLGFLHVAENKEVLSSPAPDYAVPGIKNEILSAVLAGFIGVLFTFGSMSFIGILLKNKKVVKN